MPLTGTRAEFTDGLGFICSFVCWSCISHSAWPLQLMGGTDRYEFLASELVLTYGCAFSAPPPSPPDRSLSSRAGNVGETTALVRVLLLAHARGCGFGPLLYRLPFACMHVHACIACQRKSCVRACVRACVL